MKQVCVVTGGAGFIGSHLIDNLVQLGFSIICLDNLSSGNRANLKLHLGSDHFNFILSDLGNPISAPVKESLARASYVFHLASPASPNKKNKYSYIKHPVETMLVNSYGTYQILEVLKNTKAKFLYASTSEIYGDPQTHPQAENYWGNVNPIGERSCYDEAKRFGEAITFVYLRKFGLNARVVRIFNTFGPRLIEDGRAIREFITHALKNEDIPVFGTGTQTRSFCYIEDMVEGITKAMFSPQTNAQVFNLGNPQELSIVELAKLIIDLTGSKSKIKYHALPDDDPKRRKPDISKAKRLLNWEPKTNLKTGLLQTIEYLKQSL